MDPINFSAGPAMLPSSVLQAIKAEMTNWYQGFSVLEMSHRTEPVLAMQAEIKRLLCQLLKIPNDFVILMMHGGARGQFAGIPLNLGQGKTKASYLISGYWGKQAAKACEPYLAVEQIPFEPISGKTLALNDLTIDSKSAYLHLTDNETIGGVELPSHGRLHDCVVSDMTSSLLSKPIDWSNYDCVYASAQKNLGIAGCTYVIIRKNLIGHAHALTPSILNYQVLEESDSMINTPPVFCWYVTHKVLQWVQEQGGVPGMVKLAEKRSQMLYSYIDQSDFYHNPIPQAFRSHLNIPFTMNTHETEFFQQAKEQRLYYLEGHRSFGGARASLYNAMPVAGVERLIEFMNRFEQQVRA